MPPLLLALLLAAAPAAAADLTYEGRDIFPESIDGDSAGRVYTGSLAGVVYRTDPDGMVLRPWIRPDADNGLLALLGVVADEAHGTLWVCSSAFPLRRPPAVGPSALVAFDLATGALRRRYPLPGAGAACNDIAIAANGAAFATDTGQGRILTLAPGATSLSVFAEDKAMIGIDGIAFAGDGRLYTNNVRTNAMQRVERGVDGRVRFVPLALSQPVSGPDALRPAGGNRLVQAESGGSGRIALVTIAGDRATLRTLHEGGGGTPGVAVTPRGLYATVGKVEYLFDPAKKGLDPNPFTVRHIAQGLPR
ncbi:MAG: hypothetical protein PGN09_00430 [Sphingomonas fennica]